MTTRNRRLNERMAALLDDAGSEDLTAELGPVPGNSLAKLAATEKLIQNRV